MSARQQHGFDSQKETIELLGGVPEKCYTASYDGVNVSERNEQLEVKCIKYGAPIELADYGRNRDKHLLQTHDVSEFVLAVNFHDGSDKKTIIENDLFYIPLSWWGWHFRSPDGFDDSIKDFMNNITNSYTDDSRWTEGRLYFMKIWEDYWQTSIRSQFFDYCGVDLPSRLIQLRFKRDHDKQKRVQCAIRNKDYYKYIVPQVWNKGVVVH